MKKYICKSKRYAGKVIYLCQACIDKEIPKEHEHEFDLVDVDWSKHAEISCDLCKGKFNRFAFERS